MLRVRWLALAAAMALGAAPLAAQTDLCALLAPADVVPLLGSAKSSKSFGADSQLGGCTWGGAGSGGKNNWAVMLTAPKQPPGKAVHNYGLVQANALQHPARAQKEAGLGDQAFSEIASYGVRIVILKNGRILQLQFTTGHPGTADQLAKLRVIAGTAAAAF